VKRLLLTLAYRLYELKCRLTRPIVVGVRILLIEDGSVVLVRHTYQTAWFLPGGAVKRGETLAEAAMREAYEEVGARLAQPPDLLGLYANLAGGKSDHIAVFASHAFALGPAPDRWEIEQVGRFGLNSLPADVSRGTQRRVADYLAGGAPHAGRW
jgi:8-oxo-dGTP pyrophosphatase MutT (NUDIX family)